MEEKTLLLRILATVLSEFSLAGDALFWERVEDREISVIVRHNLSHTETLRGTLKPSKRLNGFVSKKCGMRCIFRGMETDLGYDSIDPMVWRRSLAIMKERHQNKKLLQKIRERVRPLLQKRVSPAYKTLLRRLQNSEELQITDSSFTMAMRNDRGALFELCFTQTYSNNTIVVRQRHISEYYFKRLPKWYSHQRFRLKLSDQLFAMVLEYLPQRHKRTEWQLSSNVCELQKVSRQERGGYRKKRPKNTWYFKKYPKPTAFNRLCGSVDSGYDTGLNEEECQEFFFEMAQVAHSLCAKVKEVSK